MPVFALCNLNSRSREITLKLVCILVANMNHTFTCFKKKTLSHNIFIIDKVYIVDDWLLIFMLMPQIKYYCTAETRKKAQICHRIGAQPESKIFLSIVQSYTTGLRIAFFPRQLLSRGWAITNRESHSAATRDRRRVTRSYLRRARDCSEMRSTLENGSWDRRGGGMRRNKMSVFCF
jgi:hypothetical protein